MAVVVVRVLGLKEQEDMLVMLEMLFALLPSGGWSVNCMWFMGGRRLKSADCVELD